METTKVIKKIVYSFVLKTLLKQNILPIRS